MEIVLRGIGENIKPPYISAFISRLSRIISFVMQTHVKSDEGVRAQRGPFLLYSKTPMIPYLLVE